MLVTRRNESVLGSWVHVEWSPGREHPLHGAVEHIWHFNGRTALPRERVFPDGTFELIVQLDSAYRPVVDGAAGTPFPLVCAVGLRTTAETIEAPGRAVGVVGVILRPAGAFALFQSPLHCLSDRTVDARDVLGLAAEELGARCHAARSGVACVQIVANWLTRRFAFSPEADVDVANVLERIAREDGNIVIAELDEWSGRSRARFVTAFRDRVGVTPKRYARIVRFHRALELVNARNGSLGEIAHATGYYDQAHMNAEFRVHTGLNPSAFLQALRYPNSVSLAEPAALEEHFFQDAAPAVG